MTDIANWSQHTFLPTFSQYFVQLYKNDGICMWDTAYFISLGLLSFGGEKSGSTSPQLLLKPQYIASTTNSIAPTNSQPALFRIGSA